MSVRLILAVTALSGALITGGVFWMLGKNEQAAQRAAARFAAALVHNDRRAAPDGARELVTGVRSYFGPVTAARVIGTYNEHAGSGDSSRTFPVADVVLRSARGPAVIELGFDNGGIGSEEVTSVDELDPADARGLSSHDRTDLLAAFVRRGGLPANEIMFKQATARAQQAPAPRYTVMPAVPLHLSHEQRRAQRQLRCVRRARGDVASLLKCAGRA